MNGSLVKDANANDQRLFDFIINMPGARKIIHTNTVFMGK